MLSKSTIYSDICIQVWNQALEITKKTMAVSQLLKRL